MRLTIVDRDYDGRGFPLVMDVYEVARITPETFAQIIETACARYSDGVYVWLISPAGTQAEHAQHNEWGQLAHPDYYAGAKS